MRSQWQKLFAGLLCLLFSSLVSGIGFPVQTQAGEINPQLREQVLQIIRENPEVILEAVRAYQKKQQDQQKQTRQAFLQQFKINPAKVIGQSPQKGASKARILLVEFSDFQCPFCAKANETLRQFMQKHGNSVTLVYKHLPLTSIHPEALPAAKAAWAAGQQEKFWEFHDALFDQQKQLGDAFYQKTAQSLGLDMAKFERDRTSQAAAAAIEQDLTMAEKLGIDGTPFFIMNGEVFAGAIELSDLETALTKAKQGR
jgi:protein-disulfide isomerase